ncbi:arsenate reductase ArsC [Nitratifractor sp.]|uniref:arsenate reductase ArsC n=1 Tax=Nitratifractor sp. TaxID=2268144 RepID=UPI0025F36D06|nr:arsenate reductase ArsC [Nitratifractor sp.]
MEEKQKKKVLFVCVHNSARSQMAEELLRKHGGEEYEVESAGLEPGAVNPLVAQVLKEDEKIDIAEKKTRSVFDLYKAGKRFHYVVTVCDESTAQRCPLFPGVKERILMSFEDPSALTGTEEEKLEKIRQIKAQIEEEVLRFKSLVDQDLLEENFPEHWGAG